MPVLVGANTLPVDPGIEPQCGPSCCKGVTRRRCHDCCAGFAFLLVFVGFLTSLGGPGGSWGTLYRSDFTDPYGNDVDLTQSYYLDGRVDFRVCKSGRFFMNASKYVCNSFELDYSTPIPPAPASDPNGLIDVKPIRGLDFEAAMDFARPRTVAAIFLGAIGFISTLLISPCSRCCCRRNSARKGGKPCGYLSVSFATLIASAALIFDAAAKFDSDFTSPLHTAIYYETYPGSSSSRGPDPVSDDDLSTMLSDVFVSPGSGYGAAIAAGILYMCACTLLIFTMLAACGWVYCSRSGDFGLDGPTDTDKIRDAQLRYHQQQQQQAGMAMAMHQQQQQQQQQMGYPPRPGGVQIGIAPPPGVGPSPYYPQPPAQPYPPQTGANAGASRGAPGPSEPSDDMEDPSNFYAAQKRQSGAMAMGMGMGAGAGAGVMAMPPMGYPNPNPYPQNPYANPYPGAQYGQQAPMGYPPQAYQQQQQQPGYPPQGGMFYPPMPMPMQMPAGPGAGPGAGAGPDGVPRMQMNWSVNGVPVARGADDPM
jgi:hypothetical protein